MKSIDPILVEKAKQWLKIAEEDLSLAQHAFSMSSNVPYRLIGFHAQQCVEKCLKAFLVVQRIDFPYTHDVEKLLNLIPDNELNKSDLPDLSKLTDYAVSKRYPDFYLQLTKAEAIEAVEVAESIKQQINAKLKEFGLEL